jgi:hypothetical protein
MAMHVVSDQIRSDHTDEMEVRSDQIGSGQVSSTPNAVCAQLSATLHTIHYVLVQRASTTLHVCEVRRDQTKPDETRSGGVKSGGVKSGGVRSSETKQMYQSVRAYTASLRLVYRGKVQMQ